MATFIQGVTDTNLDPVLFTPDYSFLRYNLQKKDAQYEQGLKSVANSYANFQKELTDPVNIQRRDDYMKVADTQLQQIASADLSLQQNVNAANAIFDPIVTNPAIAYDMYKTGVNKAQRALMESWEASPDVETRKKFNRDIYNWLARDLNDLRQGKGDVNNYSKVKPRKAWAYIDFTDMAVKRAKELGYEVKTDTNTGKPYIVTTVNGATHRPNAEAFAFAVQDSDPLYKQQTAILAEARVESIIDNEIARDPSLANLPKQEILRRYAGPEYAIGRDNQKKYLEDLDGKYTARKAEVDAYIKTNEEKIKANPQGDEAQAAGKMIGELNGFRGKINELRGQYVKDYGNNDKEFEEKRDAFTKNFSEQPKLYYENRLRTDDAIRWSNLVSSFGSQTIKEDPAYIAMLNTYDKSMKMIADILKDKHDAAIDDAELQLKAAALANKLQGKNAKGEREKNADGTDKEADIEFIDDSSTAVSVVQRLNALRDKLTKTKEGAVQAMTAPYGGFYLLESMGANYQDVSTLRDVFTKKSNKSDYKLNADETKALKNVYTTLFAFAKQDPGQAELLQTMREQIKAGNNVGDIDMVGLLQMAIKNYKTKNSNEDQAIKNMLDYKDKHEQLSQVEAAFDNSTRLTLESMKNDPLVKEIIKKGDDGKLRIITPEELAERLPSEWYVNEFWASVTGKGKVTLTKEEKLDIARQYMQGEIDVKAEIPWNSGTEGSVINYKGRELYQTGDFSYFPLSTKDFQKAVEKINSNTFIPEFNIAAGEDVVIASPLYVLRGGNAEKMRTLLLSSTQSNSNIKTADGQDVPPENHDAIRSLIANKDVKVSYVLEKNSPLNDGKEVVRVVIPNVLVDNEKNKFSGSTYYFPINVSQKTPEILTMFEQVDETDHFMKDFSKKNKPYVIDAYESNGIKVEIRSNQPGSKLGKVIVHTKYDEDSRTYVDHWVPKEMTFDLNKITFNELKDILYNQVIMQYVNDRRTYEKQASKNSNQLDGTAFYNMLLQRLNN